MHRTDILLLSIGVILLLVLAGILYTAQTTTNKDVLYYQGPGGTYRIDLVRHGSSTDYYVHTFVENTQYIVPLGMSPYQVENVTLQPTILNSLERPGGIRAVYVTQDLDLGNKTNQDSIVALTELAKVLGSAQFSVFKLNYRSAFTTENNRTRALQIPPVTCNNVTDDQAVILLSLAPLTSVVSDTHECIIIQGPNGRELLRATYRFIYHLLGIF